jgi:ribosome-associated protein YbcJ (S4-like RNA binding protein)
MAGLALRGYAAKVLIAPRHVSVDDAVETRKVRKLKIGQAVSLANEEIRVVAVVKGGSHRSAGVEYGPRCICLEGHWNGHFSVRRQTCIAAPGLGA